MSAMVDQRYLLNNVEMLIAELNGIEEYNDRALEIVSALKKLAEDYDFVRDYLKARQEHCSSHYTRIFLSVALVAPQAAE